MKPEDWYTKVENSINALIAVQAQHDVEIEKNAAAIRDLIVVSRTQSQNLGILAENIGVLVHKVDALSDIVRSHEGRIEQLRKRDERPS
jgi:hypothetical protein